MTDPFLLPSGMSKRILVVEDQPDNRQIIRDMLAPTSHCGLSQASDLIISSRLAHSALI
jgi:CheY-like chemotaxis protein